MKLYKREDYSYVSGQETHKGHEDVAATLSDVQRYLAEQGMVAMPVVMTKTQHDAGYDALAGPAGDIEDAYNAMIKAAGEGDA